MAYINAALGVAGALYGGAAPDVPTGFNDVYGTGMGYSGGIYDNFDFSQYYGEEAVNSAWDMAKSYGGKAYDFIQQNSNLLQGMFSAYAAQKSIGEAERINDDRIALARETNDFNAQQAAIARDFNMSEAEKARAFNSVEAEQSRRWNEGTAANQRNWAEVMSNTQWQRAVADMKASGLNPMLAYMKGPAGVPSGASSSGSSASGPAASGHSASGVQANLENPFPVGLVATAAQSAKLFAEAENIKAQTRKITEGEIPLLGEQSRLSSAQEANVRTETAVKTQQLVNLQAEVDRIAELNHLTRVQIRHIREQIIVAALTGDKLQVDIRNETAVAQLHELQIPHMKNMSEAEATWFKQKVSPFISDFWGVARPFSLFNRR